MILKKFLPLCLLLFSFSCAKENIDEPYVPFVYTDSITDSEGNVYHTVTIGTQVWMAENLRSTRYANGDTIINEYYMTDWAYPTGGAICWYDHDSLAESIYGRLYNFQAVSDPRGIAPAGWHIPTNAEWMILLNTVGENPGNKLREHGTKHWTSPNAEATDVFGFAALPGGKRDEEGYFLDVRQTAFFWSSSFYPSNINYPEAWYFKVDSDTDPILALPEADVYHSYYLNGFSIRCIKD